MKRILTMAGVILVVILLIIFAVTGRKNIQKQNELQAEVEKGIAAIQAMESVDVAPIEEAITAREKAEQAEERQKLPLTERYEHAIVLGDSQALALASYEILLDSQVAAKNSMGIRKADEFIQTAISVNPSVVFITFGMNDLGIYETAEEFIEVYKQKVQMLREGLPDAKICVVSIFPASETLMQQRPSLANYESFNVALQQMSEEMGLTYIDCTGIVSADKYEGDGAHFQKSFYEEWAKFLADAAEI